MSDDIKTDIAVSPEAKIARLFIMAVVILIMMLLPILPQKIVVEKNITQNQETNQIEIFYENKTVFNSWFENTAIIMQDKTYNLLTLSVIGFAIYAAIGYIISRLIKM